MSATILRFPSGRVTSATHQSHAAEVFEFGAVSRGLTRRDMNGIEGLMARSHGAWRCEIEASDVGTSALILPNRPLLREPHGFLVSRDGHRLTILDARPSLDWPTLGTFQTLETLLDALSLAIGSFAAA